MIQLYVINNKKKAFATNKKRQSVIPCLSGAENEIRTRDPQLGKLMLYQLSYFRINELRLGFRHLRHICGTSAISFQRKSLQK